MHTHMHTHVMHACTHIHTLNSHTHTCTHTHNPGDEVKIVSTPPFAESVTEGDVKWEKGNKLVVITSKNQPGYYRV